MSWFEDGTVVTTEHSEDGWVFSTAYSAADGYHPVSGNRRFGYENNGNGTYTFYTRGVDRISTNYHRFGDFMTGGLTFTQADKLWKSFQGRIASETGGQTIEPTTFRPDYADVKAVLNGEEPVSKLGGCE